MFGSDFFGNFGIPPLPLQGMDAAGGLFGQNTPPTETTPGMQPAGGMPQPPPAAATPAGPATSAPGAAALAPSSPLSPGQAPPQPPQAGPAAPAAGVSSPFGKPSM